MRLLRLERHRAERRYHEALRAIPLFRGLTVRQIEALDGVLSEAQVAPGRRLTVSGRVGRQFAIVLEGLAVVWRDGVEVGRVGRLDFCGEHALLTGRPRSADVIALTAMHLLVAGPAEFDRMRRISPLIDERILAAERDRTIARTGHATVPVVPRPSASTGAARILL